VQQRGVEQPGAPPDALRQVGPVSQSDQIRAAAAQGHPVDVRGGDLEQQDVAVEPGLGVEIGHVEGDPGHPGLVG